MYRKGIFLILCIIATLVIIFQKMEWRLPMLINNYLNDLLVIPIVLFIARHLLSKLYQEKNFIVSIPMIVVMVLFYFLVFEGLLPLISNRYTADIIDGLMYALGGVGYYFLQKIDYNNPSSAKLK